MGPLVGWDRDRQRTFSCGSEGAVCIVCWAEMGDSLLRGEGAWCVRRGHSAHPEVWGWGQVGAVWYSGERGLGVVSCLGGLFVFS